MRRNNLWLVSILLASVLLATLAVLDMNQSINDTVSQIQRETVLETPAVVTEPPTTNSSTEPFATASTKTDAEHADLLRTSRLLALSTNPEAKTTVKVEQYLETLTSQGFDKSRQGIWMQADGKLLANYQGTTPLSVASLTKAATTLTGLEVLGVNHQFETLIGTNGIIENGVLNGDLIVQGNGDPFFIWEEAITIGNLLTQKGIRRVSGDLIVIGSFYMNYQQNSLTSGILLRESLNADLWTTDIAAQYQLMPASTPKPQIVIQGDVRVGQASTGLKLVLRHKSLPLVELLKKMNQYSNNVMADMIAEAVGGADVIARTSARLSGVPFAEISLINGSGLGVENRMSPRAVCAIFLAIDDFLQTYDMTVSDVFAVVGEDPGVLTTRALPNLSVTKSGSLSAVSAIAGALPTKTKNVVWFSIINGGENLVGFREDQEMLLNALSYEWGSVSELPPALKANQARTSKTTENELF